MENNIAYCGLDCYTCNAFLATKANDTSAKLKVIEEWEKMFKVKGLTLEFVTCDGCHATSGQLCGHCHECQIRSCGISKKVDNCAFCSQMDACSLIQDFIRNVPVARKNLEMIKTNQ